VHGKFSGSGFKTVTVAVPGCRVQRFKICVGNRPEDVQRWIAERKKRFPRTTTAHRNTTTTTTTTTTERPNNDDNILVHPHGGGDKNDTGLSALLAGYGSSDGDGDDDDSSTKDEKRVGDQASGRNENNGTMDATLIGGDVNASSLPPTEVKHSSSKSNSNNNMDGNDGNMVNPAASSSTTLSTRPCRFFFRNGSCKNGDSCRFRHDGSTGGGGGGDKTHFQKRHTTQQTTALSTGQRKRKRGGGPTSSDTLLRKLFENDMERESNLTMQLLRYIVKNNFFRNSNKETDRQVV
jgi:hypothetical protein